jgi:hypothetical protein
MVDTSSGENHIHREVWRGEGDGRRWEEEE